MRCPRAERYTPLPGSFGHHLTGTTTGPGGAFPGLGQAGAGNARLAAQGSSPPVGRAFKDHALSPRPRKPGLELSERGESPLVRAAVERRQASALRSARAARKARTVGHALVGVPPPFLFVVAIRSEVFQPLIPAQAGIQSGSPRKRGRAEKNRSCYSRSTKLGRGCVARRVLLVRPRGVKRSGGGGPPRRGGGGGMLSRNESQALMQASRPTPLPPPFGGSPFPAFAGQDEARAFARTNLEQKSTGEADIRAISGAVQYREGDACARLLQPFQILADLPVQALPQSQTLQRRSECLPEAAGEGGPARNPVEGAPTNPGVDAGECRSAGARGARVPSGQFL